MFDVERKERIIEILKEHGSCSVAKLSRLLNFSEATIRRDLNALDKEMKITKTFGGAVIRESYGNEVPTFVRKSENVDVKRSLARACARYIKDNMTVFLCASTTVEQIVPYILGRTGLTVITNSPDIPKMLANTEINVYSTGGKYLHHSNSYVGEFARQFIEKVNADLVVFSPRGVSSKGKITNSSTEDDVILAMIKNSKKACVLFDATKLDKTYPFTVCNLSDVDVIISNTDLAGDITGNAEVVKVD